MAKRVVILGGGPGGTLTANRLRRLYPRSEVDITVIDQDDRHVYQPGLLFVPFGLAHIEEIVRPRGRQFHHGIDYVKSAIDHVDLSAQTVQLSDGSTLGYDVLIVATGAVLVPEETEGLTGFGLDGEGLHLLLARRCRRTWSGTSQI
jgi:sulfide:quinone oxidoreductase